MCIISFYKKDNQFILTHNRDEEIQRATSYEIEEQIKFNEKYYSPIDKRANGTWIFYSEKYIACILNGGEEKPIHLKEKYKESRGIILLDLLKYNSVRDYINNESFIDIAPFTIFVFEKLTHNSYLLHWDEKDLIMKDMTGQEIVTWCSSTIYSVEDRKKITKVFYENNTIKAQSILNLHHKMKMNKGDLYDYLATTSISQIIFKNLRVDMKTCQLF